MGGSESVGRRGSVGMGEGTGVIVAAGVLNKGKDGEMAESVCVEPFLHFSAHSVSLFLTSLVSLTFRTCLPHPSPPPVPPTHIPQPSPSLDPSPPPVSPFSLPHP